MLLLLPVLLTACAASAPLVSSDPAAALYFVLHRGETDSTATDAYALVATAALPADSRYLAVDALTARRVSDGNPLAFEVVPRSGPIASSEFGAPPSYPTADGNLRLRASGIVDQLGARDIQPGDSIEMQVVAEGTAIAGAMRVPRRPLVQVRLEGGQRIVSWGGDPGTALWLLTVGRGGLQLRDTVVNLDSAFTPFALEGADSVRVTAYDANLAAYLVPPFRDAAGVRGGLGVFGASVEGRAVALP